MDEFEELVKDVLEDKDKYIKMFDGADEAEDIAVALKQIIDDDKLWEELATSKLDRIGLIALVGSFAIQFSGAIEPIVEVLNDYEED
jgi:hypothetical protein